MKSYNLQAPTTATEPTFDVSNEDQNLEGDQLIFEDPSQPKDLSFDNEEEEQRLEEEEETLPLERFGAGIFDKEVKTFAPVDNIPVPEGYRLGAGDTLSVMLLGKEEDELQVTIQRDGKAFLPSWE